MLSYVYNGKKTTGLKFAVMPLNDSGYTFPNMLIAFMATLVIVSTFSPLLLFFFKIGMYEQDINGNEWNLFLVELHREVKAARQIEAANNTFSYINSEGELITVSHYNDLIRYQVEGKGHVVLLRNVRNAQFSAVKNGVKIAVTSKNGKKYEGSIRDVKGVLPK